MREGNGRSDRLIKWKRENVIMGERERQKKRERESEANSSHFKLEKIQGSNFIMVPEIL